jgi:hypothetical protein
MKRIGRDPVKKKKKKIFMVFVVSNHKERNVGRVLLQESKQKAKPKQSGRHLLFERNKNVN